MWEDAHTENQWPTPKPKRETPMMPDKPSAEEFRKQWSHKPTPIPPDATGLWYSVECIDQMLSEYAAHLEQALREKNEEIERLKHPILIIRDSLVENAQIQIESLRREIQILKKPSRRIVITCAGNVDISMEKG